MGPKMRSTGKPKTVPKTVGKRIDTGPHILQLGQLDAVPGAERPERGVCQS